MEMTTDKAMESRDMVYYWGPDYFRIQLKHQVPRRIFWLLISEFLLLCGLASWIVFHSWSPGKPYWTLIPTTGAFLLYLLATYRLVDRILYKEQIFVDNQGMTLIFRTPFRRKIWGCAWEDMGPVRYVGMEKKTDHPLKGNSFDYLGFETHENLTRFIHHEGNLQFQFNGETIPFGRALYSWDAEDLVRMINLYTGNRLPLGPEWSNMASMESGEAAY